MRIGTTLALPRAAPTMRPLAPELPLRDQIQIMPPMRLFARTSRVVKLQGGRQIAARRGYQNAPLRWVRVSGPPGRGGGPPLRGPRPDPAPPGCRRPGRA